MSTASTTVSLAQVRRTLVHHQRFTGRFRRARAAEVEAEVRRLTAVQLDSISTVDRAHRLTLGARIGAFAEDVPARLLREGRIFEYWAHEACLLPIELYPHFRRAMDGRGHWGAHDRALREHYGCLTHAVSMLEATDQVAQEREPNPALYRMLVRALLTLAADPSPLVSGAFFWKLLSLEGFHPMLDECVRCGAGEDAEDAAGFVAFDLDEGGLLCREHRRGSAITPEAVVLLRQVLTGRLHEALNVAPTPAALEVEQLATRSLEHHLERRLLVEPAQPTTTGTRPATWSIAVSATSLRSSAVCENHSPVVPLIRTPCTPSSRYSSRSARCDSGS